MSEGSGSRGSLTRIVVRIRVGRDRMAATDDPLFLLVRGPGGREFRLAAPHGRSLRRGAEDVYVLGPPDDAETNVARPELNDPTQPPLALEAVQGVVLRKGLEPIPNVRGRGEMDDRLQIEEAEVELHAAGRPKPARYTRAGPVWLGLVCGLEAELSPAGEPSE